MPLPEIITTAKMPELPIVRLIKADEMAIFAHWPFLREKLIEFRDKFKQRPSSKHVPIRWEPEHFRFEWLKNAKGGFAASNLELFLALSGPAKSEVVEGFFCTTIEYDPFIHIPSDFLIWIAWSNVRYLLEACWVQARDIAIARGCTGIKHMSPYLQWGRRQRQMNRRIAEIYGIKMPEWRANYVLWRADLYEDEQ